MEQKVKLKLRAEKLTEDKLPLTKLRQEISTCPTASNLWEKSIESNIPETIIIKEQLFTMLISQYLTLRGFAFAAHWMETYKYKNRKTVTKSKSLRSKLQECRKEE